ncbi:PDZ domain-containing protein [Chitinophaga sp. Ak27]|uniref:PDZ domain-containing protein n=1 Tax=Chitinophaga sp. Ak27 TaxID=2726116 RepID=UPI00145CDC6B|nr:PDZ domain-containing protein [Chitinophaga sp. Ak27]NLU93897.1 PDZ domain-containing protein [Chitinophaga sp. Ak27]
MTRLLQILTLAGFSCFTMSAVSAQSQTPSKDQMGEFDEIVIKHKSDKDGKVTVEIKKGDILVNGEKIDQYNDPNLSVFRRKITPRNGNTLSFDSDNPRDNFSLFNDDNSGGDEMPLPVNKAMLGVITEKKAATGVTVKSVAKGTPADKSGIKPGDIITAVGPDKINEPAELYEAIGKHAPSDEITITYIRDGKPKSVIVKLEARKDLGTGEGWNNLPPRNMPRSFSFPSPYPRGGQPFGYGWHHQAEEGEKLGLQVQDTENDEGAVVIDIAPGSAAAKAGFQKNDIVTELAGTPVKNVADLSATYRDNLEKGQFTATVKRNNSATSLTVKVPKKLNKADL